MARNQIVLFSALGLILLAAEGARLAWYGTADPAWKSQPVLTCSFSPEVDRGDMEGSQAAEILSYDEAEVVRFAGPPARPWQMEAICLAYHAGNKRHLNDLFTHSPEICLRGSGAELVRILEPERIEIDDQKFAVRHLVFRHPITSELVNVFRLYWIGGMKEAGLDGTETIDDFRVVRFKVARARYGYPPALLLLANVAGAKSDQAAWEIFRDNVVAGLRFD